MADAPLRFSTCYKNNDDKFTITDLKRAWLTVDGSNNVGLLGKANWRSKLVASFFDSLLASVTVAYMRETKIIITFLTPTIQYGFSIDNGIKVYVKTW